MIQKSPLSINVEHRNLRRFIQIVDVFIFVSSRNIQKGFGAQKIPTDFKEIERNVQEQEKLREQQVHLDIKNREETERQLEKQMYTRREMFILFFHCNDVFYFLGQV